MTIRSRIAFAAAVSLALAGAAPAVAQSFSADQREEIGKIIKDYLLTHPEVMQDVMAELEKRQQSADAEKHRAAVVENKATLFSSPHQVVLGNPQGNVTMVEFFDYNCGFCKRAMTDMLDLIKTDNNLKFVLKEFPVPMGRSTSNFTKSSLAAAAPPTRCALWQSPRKSASTCPVWNATWAATRSKRPSRRT
jgi:protein-disulfide isomerase